jgi:hypothetical protein
MLKDDLGIEILPTDCVMVTSYGAGARMMDCGLKRRIIRINKNTVTILDADDKPRAINPVNLTVLRRTPQAISGFEALDQQGAYDGNTTRSKFVSNYMTS